MKNTFTKILILAFALLATVQSFAIKQIDGDWEEYGLTSEYDGYYVIATAEDLYEFHRIAYNEKINAVLTADIVLNESVLDENGDLRSDYETAGLQEWTPIYAYSGTFDGRNHVISGLFTKGYSYVGFFGQVNGGVVIKNIKIVDSYFEGDKVVGGICAHANREGVITISNCSVNAYIYAKVDQAGGIYGGYEYSGITVENCVNLGKVISKGGSVGGICSISNGKIIGCVNKGIVRGNGDRVGGILGNGYGSSISDCYNVGIVEGCTYVGGIAGYGNRISNSCNSGTINGLTNVGGIAGLAYYSLENVYNVGDVIANAGVVGGLAGTVKNVSYAYNAGIVSNNSKSNNVVGSLCGVCSGTMKNCYYDSDVCSFGAVNNSSYAGATAKTTSAMCSTTLLTGFSSDIWAAGTPDVSGSVIPKDDEFATKTIGRYPRLKFIDPYTFVPYAREIYYNIGTPSIPEWESCKLIFSIQDLEKMASYPTATFVLMNDIIEFGNISDGNLLETPVVEWPPISLFEGKLYGRGKTIAGLCKTSTTDNGGLFGEVRNAIIKDLNIADCRFDGKYVGGITGKASCETSIINCNNFCNFNVSSAESVGGICGYINNYEVCEKLITIKNCNNYGIIKGSTSYGGGICGYAYSQLNIIECANYGDIVSSTCGGGIIGYGYARYLDKGIIQECINRGKISSKYAGGIAGEIIIFTNINYCLNSGLITGIGRVGGIVGSENSGDHMYQCLNVASVETNAIAGGICADVNGLFAEYNYFNSDKCLHGAISDEDNYSNYGMTTSELINGNLPSGFSSEYWAIRSAEVKDMKKYYYYPYLKCYGADSAILAVVRDCHSVTMNFNGGTTTDDVISFYVETEEAQLPRNLVKEGCTFAGWYDNSNYTSSAFTEIPLTETQPKTFYAKWIANNYSITYELDGGTVNSGKNTTYTYGYGVILPTDVTKTGYTFKGWYDNPQCEGESILAIPANATGNKTYYANWVVNTYNVTFFTYEGVMNTDIDSYTFGKETVLPTEVTKSGYDFAGWYTNDSYSGVAIQSIASNETGDKTYYAKWNKKSYSVSVTYDKAMGSVSGIDSYLHGDNAVLKAHADAGYEFASWSCDDETILADKNVQDSTLTFVVTGPIELTATFKFKEIVYPAAEFVIGTLQTETEITPIDLASLFETSEGGEVTYMVTSSSPNVLLPQIENGKLYLSTMGLQGKATITVTAKLANGNKSSLSAEAVVEYNCNIHVVPTIVNASCYGFSDGSISLAAENDYSYQWIGEEVTTNKIENVKAGNYSVQITDERGCKSLETYTVSQPDEISVEIAEVVNPRCGVQSEIRLNAAGDYTYLWSNGSTGKDLIGAEIGNYSVVVTNPETGCSTTLTQSLELTFQKPQISLVTVSRETGKNLIVWVRENTDQIAYYTIYRENSEANKFNAIGTLKYSEISVFEDEDADPMARQWSYKISATDVCGNETELSEAHTTLHLNEMESLHEGKAELIWQPYEGLEYNSFYIVRETKVNNYTFIDTVTTVPSTLTSYTAEIPPVGKSIFYVGIKLDKVIDPKKFLKAESGPFVIALSNIAEAENNVAVCRITKSNAEVYAIGHTLYIMNPENLEVSIFDINGRKIDVPQTSKSSEFLVKNDGVYLVKVGESTFKVIIK